MRYRERLTADEYQLVNAFRGLPPERQAYLRHYAAQLVAEHVSDGRVLANPARCAEYARAEMEIAMARKGGAR
jgi:hypothetical protein